MSTDTPAGNTRQKSSSVDSSDARSATTKPTSVAKHSDISTVSVAKHSNTPVVSASISEHNQNNQSNDVKQSLMTSAQFKELKGLISNIINKKFEDLTATLTADIAKIKEEISAVGNKTKAISEELSTLKEKSEKDSNTLKDLGSKVDGLDRSLSADVGDLHNRVIDLEQYTRINNIEIRGIPETNEENVIGILSSVAKLIDVKFEETQVGATHRVPTYTTGEHKPIIVRFISRQTKNAWLNGYALTKKTRKVRCLNTQDFKRNFPVGDVYISEHLCYYRKQLLAKTKAFAKAKGIKHVFTNNGCVYVKKDDTAKKVKICSEEDFRRL